MIIIMCTLTAGNQFSKMACLTVSLSVTVFVCVNVTKLKHCFKLSDALSVSCFLENPR